MANSPQPALPPDLCHMDDDETALAALSILADRMAYHTKRLRIIQYVSGAEGVAAHKAKYPEARTIQTRATTIAFQPKPEGYTAFMCGLVDRWFISDVALAETNKAAVERLNRAVHPRRFNPDNHFSKPLSGSLLRKLADVFAKHGAHLDTGKPLTMANVKAAVKVAKVKRSPGRPFGGVGYVSDGRLCLGDESFTIHLNGNRHCIRPTINGRKRRIYLDDLEWMLSLSSSCRTRIGDRDYRPASTPQADPLADDLAEIGPAPSALQSGEQDCASPGASSLTDRIAALKAVVHPEAAAESDHADPLAF